MFDSGLATWMAWGRGGVENRQRGLVEHVEFLRLANNNTPCTPISPLPGYIVWDP